MILKSGILCCGMGVLLGAFGAHGLRSYLSEEMLQIYQTGVTYQIWHGMALILLSLWGVSSGLSVRGPGRFFLSGICFFSGSLYLLSWTGVKAWGMVTPVGGILFLLGWGLWAWRAFRGTGIDL